MLLDIGVWFIPSGLFKVPTQTLSTRPFDFHIISETLSALRRFNIAGLCCLDSATNSSLRFPGSNCPLRYCIPLPSLHLNALASLPIVEARLQPELLMDLLRMCIFLLDILTSCYMFWKTRCVASLGYLRKVNSSELKLLFLKRRVRLKRRLAQNRIDWPIIAIKALVYYYLK